MPANAGTYLHGLAGELAATAIGATASVLAGDVLGKVGEAVVEVGTATRSAPDKAHLLSAN